MKYRISLCLIFKNEAPFLKEWLDYHLSIGIDHFYLYNNNSDDDYMDIVKPYVDKGIVTLIEWPEPNSQFKCNLYGSGSNDKNSLGIQDNSEEKFFSEYHICLLHFILQNVIIIVVSVG